jgi:uncharacterized protein (TIGR03067 family)
MKLALEGTSWIGAWLLVATWVTAAEVDLEKLQGKWIIESFLYNGNPVEMMKDAVRQFKDDKYTLVPKNSDGIEGTFKLDSEKKPREIDMVVNGRMLKGIYDLDGDTLKVSYSLTGGERPTEFESKPDSGTTLIVHKRMK